MDNIRFLKHSYMFRCLYIILRESLIMYARVTKLIQWKHYLLTYSMVQSPS